MVSLGGAKGFRTGSKPIQIFLPPAVCLWASISVWLFLYFPPLPLPSPPPLILLLFSSAFSLSGSFPDLFPFLHSSFRFFWFLPFHSFNLSFHPSISFFPLLLYLTKLDKELKTLKVHSFVGGQRRVLICFETILLEFLF